MTQRRLRVGDIVRIDGSDEVVVHAAADGRFLETSQRFAGRDWLNQQGRYVGRARHLGRVGCQDLWVDTNGALYFGGGALTQRQFLALFRRAGRLLGYEVD